MPFSRAECELFGGWLLHAAEAINFFGANRKSRRHAQEWFASRPRRPDPNSNRGWGWSRPHDFHDRTYRIVKALNREHPELATEHITTIDEFVASMANDTAIGPTLETLDSCLRAAREIYEKVRELAGGGRGEPDEIMEGAVSPTELPEWTFNDREVCCGDRRSPLTPIPMAILRVLTSTAAPVTLAEIVRLAMGDRKVTGSAVRSHLSAIRTVIRRMFQLEPTEDPIPSRSNHESAKTEWQLDRDLLLTALLR